MSDIAYEIAGLFLLAALLMYGTLSGFLPKVFRAGKAVPWFLGAAAALFGLYYFAPDISRVWSSLTGSPSEVTSTEPVQPSQSKTTSPVLIQKRPAAPVTSHAVTDWKTVTADPSIPIATATPTNGSDGTLRSADAPVQVNAAPKAPPPDAESSGDSPFDSGIQRAAKHVGRFLHIGRRKGTARQDSQP